MAADDLELARTQSAAPVSGETPTLPGEGGEPRSQPLASARVGRHTILRVLGEGGMGVVYAAYDEQLDRKIALKLLHAERSGGTEGRGRIMREAQALARVSHPHVVQIHEVGEYERQIYVAMELVEGVTLAAWQRSEGRSLAAILDAYRQAGEGLDAAHRVGLVHRDFKPENALVGADGRVRVVDFGLARAAGGASREAADALAGPDGRMTVSGAVMGTPAYMSPEQFTGGTIDARSDVFSFSVALWEAIHGERPFAGDTLPSLVASVLAGERRPPRVELPARLAQAIGRGLAVDPAARWPTLRPLLDALAVDPTADPSAAPEQRRRFAWVMLTLVGVLFVSLSVTVLMGQEGAFRDRSVVFGLVAALVIVGVAFSFRLTLLRNTYHRKVLLFLVTMAVVGSSQRAIGLVHGLPLIDILLDSFHLMAGTTLIAAICFARWFAVLTAIAAVAIALGVVWPEAYPAAMVVLMPAIVLTFVYFLRRDAAANKS